MRKAMRAKTFVNSILDKDIPYKQPIGITCVSRDRYPCSFSSGCFSHDGFSPTGMYVELYEGAKYIPRVDELTKFDGETHGEDITRTNTAYTIFTNKESFEKRMQSLMTVIKTKDNFPLFIRDLSKLKWNHNEECS
jgi:hypothetical protein